MGSIGGWFWTEVGWAAVTTFTGFLLMVALIAALVLLRFTRISIPTRSS
jgi:hypothetical protein